MNEIEVLQQPTSAQMRAEPLDSATPAEQMRVIDEAMRYYFGAKDWVRERNQVLPGLARRT